MAPEPTRPRSGAEEPPAPVELVYAVHDGVTLRGDLYRPVSDAVCPVVVAVSGGGFRRGHRRMLAGWGAYLARHGLAVFCIDYRQATQAKTFPEAVQDVLAAVQYVAGEATRLRLDAARIALLGASAGAHLASLVALSGNDAPFFGAYAADAHAGLKPAVRALVAAYGVYDMFAHWQETRASAPAPGDDLVEGFMGQSPFVDPSLYTLASPLRHVRHAANALKVLLTWGSHDEVVLPSQSEGFCRALEQAHFHVRTLPVLGAGHFWFSEDPIDDPRGHTAGVAPRVARFLARHLA